MIINAIRWKEFHLKETDILFKTKTYYYKFIQIYQFYKRSLSSKSIMSYNYSLCTGLSYDES